jgi:hypothetical protein
MSNELKQLKEIIQELETERDYYKEEANNGAVSLELI